MSKRKTNLRALQKLIDRTPAWLFLTVAALVMVFFTLMTMSEMGWLPFEMQMCIRDRRREPVQQRTKKRIQQHGAAQKMEHAEPVGHGGNQEKSDGGDG